jgi:hypothetical protein
MKQNHTLSKRIEGQRNRNGKVDPVWEHDFPSSGNLVAAEAGEVLLVDGRAGRATGVATGSTTASSGGTATGGTVTTGSTVAATRATTATLGALTTTGGAVTTGGTATAGSGAGAGRLNVAEVNVEEVLLLALLLALGLLGGTLDVSLLFGLGELLSGSPLLVELCALVGSALGLSGQSLLLGLLGQVVGERLGVVGLLDLLSGSLGLGLLGLGDLLALALVVPGLLAALGTPALLDLLAGVAGYWNSC